MLNRKKHKAEEDQKAEEYKQAEVDKQVKSHRRNINIFCLITLVLIGLIVLLTGLFRR